MSEDATNHPAPVSADDLAYHLVSEAERTEPDVEKMLGYFQDLVAILKFEKDPKRLEVRDNCYTVAVQKFIDLHDPAALSRILRLRAVWTGNRPGFGTECAAILKEASRERLIHAKVDCCEFGRIRPVDSLNRFDFLYALKPGTIVADKTWGYGEVVSEDTFYRTLKINFDSKPGNLHTMGFAFAADSLRPISENHILVIRHRDPEAFAKQCAEHPGEIVKLALQSYGNMTALQLQTTLCNGILPAQTDWKKFWETARHQLTREGSVRIPPVTRKTAPLELVHDKPGEAVDETDAAFHAYAALKDPKAILDQTERFLRGAGADVLTDEQRALITDRLGYTLRAAVADRKLGNPCKIMTILLARRAGLESISVRLGDTAEEEFAFEGEFKPGEENVILLNRTLCMPPIILDAAHKLPAARMGELVEALPIETDMTTALSFIEVIPEMSSTLLDRIAPKLLTGVAAEPFAEFLHNEFAKLRPSYPLLRWVCHAYADKALHEPLDRIFSPFALVTFALASLENETSGEDLKMKNDIRKLVTGGGRTKSGTGKTVDTADGARWLLPLVEKMSEGERATIFVRLFALEKAIGKYTSTKLVNSMLAHYPELNTLVPHPEAEPVRGFFVENATSFRSYQQRKAAYDRLMNEEMPQNRKDIEHAKSFGDLSENFEYETARNTERALIARQTQYEKELAEVKGFDFAADVPEQNGLVGMGSSVTVLDEAGTQTTYAILGVWDSDQTLNIISCETPLAKALLDHHVGDEILLDVGDERKSYRIVSVDPLPPAVLEWAAAV